MEQNTINVLLVDDETRICSTLAGYLEDDGYKTHISNSGEQALELMSNASFDVLIVDMRLPGIDGNELILKAFELYPKTKFMIHTGSVEYILPKPLKNIGVQDKYVFYKPVRDLNVISNAVRELMGE